MKISLIFTGIILSFLTISAQVPTSPKVVVYRPFYDKDTITNEPETETGTLDDNCIKWNSFLMPKGVFNINFERMVSPNISLELGAGLTYRDYIFELSNDGVFDFMFNDDRYTRSYGPMFSMSMRYYMTGGNLEGAYVAPLVRYRKYSMNTIPDAASGQGNQKIGYRMLEYGLVFGYQWDTWFDWELCREIYVGVGYADQLLHKFDDHDGNSPGSWVEVKQQHPILFFGGTFGIPFRD